MNDKKLNTGHAKALSALGASKGGKARAEALTKTERSEIARRAANARWGTKKMHIPKETHPGILQIGAAELRCGVLEGGIRVFSTRGFTRAMGGKQQGTKGSSTGAPQLPAFLLSNNIKPFISGELMARLITPIEYQPNHGGRTAYGYEAKILSDICEVILDANDDEPFRGNQQHLVKTANQLIRGFAKIGVIAAVDKATGYEDDQTKAELTKILEAYIEPALRPYVPKFRAEFFKEVYRIHGWEYKPGNTRSPRYIGKFINKYIYEPLPPGVLEKLRELNPSSKGQRRHKHFQFLTDDIGEPHLDRQVAVTTSLLTISDNKDMFKSVFTRAFSKHYQRSLPGMESEALVPLVLDVSE